MQGAPTILLIEDNPDDERLTLRALRRNNIDNEVVVAYDGEQALAQLANDSIPLPAVVILDLRLPKLSGLEVLKAIRSNLRTTLLPVVVLTASDDVEQMQEAYAGGANSFIRKPTDPAEFSEMVFQLAMYWLLLNRAPRQATGIR